MATADVAPTVQWMEGSVNLPLVEYPANSSSLDPQQTAEAAIKRFNEALDKKDYDGLSNQFLANGYWRDHLALTWEFHTTQTPAKIAEFLKNAATTKDGFRILKLTIDESAPTRKPALVKVDGNGTIDVVQFYFTFDGVVGTGEGLARVAVDGTDFKIYTLYTLLTSLKGYEEPLHGRRPAGVDHGQHPGRKNWLEKRIDSINFEDGTEPAVLIVGAGQAGLTVAARLKMLNVPTLAIDKNERVGDSWRNRYHQLVLHDPVWYDHLPYLNFPPMWPVFSPKDKIGGLFEAYAQLMELNIWMRSTLVHTHWDDNKQRWNVVIKRTKDDGEIEVRTFHPRHIIQATGHSGKKAMPNIQGIDGFKGHLLCHSSEFPGARKDGQGKKAIVVGCCNSGHDIAHNYQESGYDVTIVQRSSTHVVSSKAITDIALKGVYSEDGPPVDDADLIIHGMPNALLKTIQVQVGAIQRDYDRELLDGLTKAGFKLDDGPDGSGLFFKYFQRGGGYYIDVGASKLIADGKIKVKQGQQIAEVLPNGLKFADGDVIEADEIIFATGYENMRTQARIMFGDDVADKCKDVWGMNEEGEWRTIWQDSGHPGFWFHGGNMALCRFYSRLVALQIKGQEEGLYKRGEK
ncbi:hypothetical protein VHEMI05427 [[Torrubiella] hemipterigena]|uniref:Flavin-containing monooxygenase n=1 Tax=[Torrubiella] hemipterigena TaxID=1531966 RepID=A0A0A1SXX1_9HYPO|nr:hypothetical protein VHEMI05427 [[Torrubiella] hemipterigena]